MTVPAGTPRGAELLGKKCIIDVSLGLAGGEGGIRTLDRDNPVPPFQGGDLNHSSTSPLSDAHYSVNL